MSSQGGVIENMGFTPQSRSILYYGICIWVRLCFSALLVVLAYYEYYRVVGGTCIVLGVAAIIANALGLYRQNKVWWSRGFHLVTGVLLLCTSVLLFLRMHVSVYILAVILSADVLVGVVMSFLKRVFTQYE